MQADSEDIECHNSGMSHRLNSSPQETSGVQASSLDTQSSKTEIISCAEPTEESTHSPVHYTDADFESEDDSDPSSDEHRDIADDNSDETMEQSSSWKEVPRTKKYKQTTLNFGQSAAASASARSSGKPPGSRESYFRHMGDKDTEMYRLGYPGQKDDLKLNANLRFYKGEISSFPDGAFIDEIHNDWWGHYELLERHHGYIQWIFPIREDGMNWQAQALQRHEAEAILADETAHNRVLLSYEMMLDFFGMKLEDRRTGQLTRSRNWRERYHNLNYSSHNYLRITRMLKSLGEFDLEHLKKPFLEFILSEIFQHNQLTRSLNSLRNYWIGTIRNDADRQELHRYVDAQEGL